VLERPQIPDNNKGACRQRQIMQGASHRFFFGMPTLGVPSMVGDLDTRLRGRGTKPGATEEATVDWSGMSRPQHQTSVRWSNCAGFSYSLVLMVQPCGGG